MRHLVHYSRLPVIAGSLSLRIRAPTCTHALLQDIVFTGDEEDTTLPDPAERFEELLTRCVFHCVWGVCVLVSGEQLC